MKKNKVYTTVMLAAMIAVLSLGLTACGDDPVANPQDLVGTWECSIYLGDPTGRASYVQSAESLLQLRADGTFVAVNALNFTAEYAAAHGGSTYSASIEHGKWHTKGQKIYLIAVEYDLDDREYDFDDEVARYSLNGNTLSLTATDDGVSVQLKYAKVADSRINKYL